MSDRARLIHRAREKVPSERRKIPARQAGAAAQTGACASGAALVHVFRTQYDQMVRFCRLRIACRQDAEDLVQEAFAAVRRAYPDKGADELRPILFTTLRNLTINYLKSSHFRRRRISDDVGDMVDRLKCEQTPTPETQLIDAQRLGIAQQALDAMSPRRREALRLHRLEGLTYEDIARRLSVSVRTVKSDVAGALAEIAARLAQAEGRDLGPSE